MKVINYTFHDVDDLEAWQPEDIYDFDQWMMATVGDENGGSDYQLHICTPVSISRLESKRHVFMIDRWEGIPELIQKLNEFIQSIEDGTTNVLEHELAKHWAWEYEGM